MRLLLFNLRTDADDHILGFTTVWINALAQHYEAVDVITTHAGRIAAATNVTVYSIGREKGYGSLRRVFEFYRILLRLLLTHPYTACFAHMQPLFATMSGIPLRLFGVPLTTWYTHRQMNWQVQWAERFSRRVVSAVADSFPMATPKLRVTGHGIDTEFYKPETGKSSVGAQHVAPSPRIVYVARLTAIKHQATLLKAVVPLDCEVVLIGDLPDGYDDSYKRELLALVQTLAIADRVIFAGAQTPEQVRDWYQNAAVAVNLAPPGLFDKAALEGMACGLPVLVSNPAFEPLTAPYQAQLQLTSPDDAAGLTKKLQALFAMPPEERGQIGEHLRQRVIQQHSLSALIERLVKILNTGEA